MGLNNIYFISSFFLLLALLIVCQLLRLKIPQLEEKIVLGQKGLLLLYSYLFAGILDYRFAVCIAIITIGTYLVALYFHKTKETFVIWGGTSLLLLILGYFKYCNFFLTSFCEFLGREIYTLNVILPIGISFYTFTAIAYLMDIKWGKYAPEKNILDFALFIGLFTKITAGPIIRVGDFLPQLKQYKGLNWQNFGIGIQIFAYGLFKKMVLADRLGVFVNDVFFAPSAYNTFTVVLASLSYTLQIYFDFAGYSDMAIGLSKILGFNFPANFNFPYIARNMSDFWKRWHISLSSWFMDYVYIPLGGSRKGESQTYVNMIVVMLLSGLWHGAGWTFIFWGFCHGIASCISRILARSEIIIKYANSSLCRVIGWLATFITVSLLWVVFRATSFKNAIDVYVGMFTIHDGIMQPYAWTFFALIVLILTTLKMKKYVDDGNYYPLVDLTTVKGMTIFFTFVGLTIMLGYYGNTAFIYGRF